MKRLFDTYLQQWKDSPNRKPMIIRGARQVGKTYCVEKFGEGHFEHFLSVNMEQDTDLLSVFESMKPQQIIDNLTALFQIPLIDGKSLLFIDEIQLAPKAIAALRYFQEQRPGLHVIAAGSLLDHTLNEIRYSMPVGRVEFAYMYPLTFLEFLIANGEQGLGNTISNFTLDVHINLAIHKKISEYLQLYFYIGGMPEAVNVYLQTKNLLEVEKVHANLLSSIEYDFAKYGTRKQQEYLRDVLQYCANNIGKKVKYSAVNRNATSAMLKESFFKLEMSRIVHLVVHTKSSKVPLSGYADKNTFKPLFMDIGLVCRLAGISLIDLKDLSNDFEGSLAEQFVGQELIAAGAFFKESQLYYWNRDAKNANAEIDYLYQNGNSVFPVEVKAGKRGTLKSLHVFLAEKEIQTGIRLNLDLPSYAEGMEVSVNLKNKKNLTYNLLSLPMYLVCRLEELEPI